MMDEPEFLEKLAESMEGLRVVHRWQLESVRAKLQLVRSKIDLHKGKKQLRLNKEEIDILENWLGEGQIMLTKMMD